jgi:hypothetical protein
MQLDMPVTQPAGNEGQVCQAAERAVMLKKAAFSHLPRLEAMSGIAPVRRHGGDSSNPGSGDHTAERGVAERADYCAPPEAGSGNEAARRRPAADNASGPSTADTVRVDSETKCCRAASASRPVASIT